MPGLKRAGLSRGYPRLFSKSGPQMPTAIDSFCLDSSALAKRYVTSEAGSELVTEICTNSDANLVISRLAQVEFVSTLARRQRTAELTATDVAEMWDSYLAHRAKRYLVVELLDSLL